MTYWIISILSIISETVFMFYFLLKIKQFKKHRIVLFVGIILCFYLSGLIVSYNYFLQTWVLLIYNILLFLFLKILYKGKTEVLDFFVIGYIGFMLSIASIIGASIMEQNLIDSIEIVFAISRLILIIFILVSNKRATKYYNSYIGYWDRHDNGKFKAITIRNISLIFINISLYIVDIFVKMYM